VLRGCLEGRTALIQRSNRDADVPETPRAIAAKLSAAPPRKDRRMTTDWTKLVADLERLLKLRSIPFGMKLYERREEMAAIPRIRRPKAVHTLDQIVA
jgi:hypothetical protein